MNSGDAEYFTEVYSADWSWLDTSAHGRLLELSEIMDLLANYCFSSMY